MFSGPLVSERYHEAVCGRIKRSAEALTCAPAMIGVCPRGDLNPHALLGH